MKVVGSHGREYLHTFPIECGHFSPNVGNYTIHGSYGNYTGWAQKAAVISIEFYMVPIDTIINWCQWGEKSLLIGLITQFIAGFWVPLSGDSSRDLSIPDRWRSRLPPLSSGHQKKVTSRITW